MKLGRLTNPQFHDALASLSKQPMPLRVAFKLKGIIAKVREEFDKLEECRLEALRRYGKRGEDGEVILNEDGTIELDSHGMDNFAKDMNDLGKTDLEFPTIQLSELGDKVMLTADDALVLDGILVE